MFFQSKQKTIKTAITGAVYREVHANKTVLVIGISRPEKQPPQDVNSAMSYRNVRFQNENTQSSYVAMYYKPREDRENLDYMHNKKVFPNNIVLVSFPNIGDCLSIAMPMSHFLKNYSLVIGYASDGSVITESDIDFIKDYRKTFGFTEPDKLGDEFGCKCGGHCSEMVDESK